MIWIAKHFQTLWISALIAENPVDISLKIVEAIDVLIVGQRIRMGAGYVKG